MIEYGGACTVSTAQTVLREVRMDHATGEGGYPFWRSPAPPAGDWKGEYPKRPANEPEPERLRTLGKLSLERPEAGLANGDLLLMLLQAPLRVVEQDVPVEMKAGELCLLDPAALGAAALAGRGDPCLNLTRAAIQTVVGADPMAGGVSVRRLADDGLAAFLVPQMRLLAAQAVSLGAEERAAALENTLRLALAMLRATFGVSSSATNGERVDGPLTAAKRYIERWHSRHDLSPDEVASMVNCSRRQLYRLFARERLTVAGYLREVRLQRCRSDLQTCGRKAKIGSIAYARGFDDLPAFSKLFKRRFGVSPSEYQSACIA